MGSGPEGKGGRVDPPTQKKNEVIGLFSSSNEYDVKTIGLTVLSISLKFEDLRRSSWTG